MHTCFGPETHQRLPSWGFGSVIGCTRSWFWATADRVSLEPERHYRDGVFWGYDQMPCRDCPRLGTFIDWMYVIDLDQNVFRVNCQNDVDSSGDRVIKYFRLDNILQWLFELESAPEGEEWSLRCHCLSGESTN